VVAWVVADGTVKGGAGFTLPLSTVVPLPTARKAAPTRTISRAYLQTRYARYG
jgi:hypothetical protein